jgi:tetratricopeptide (TPR) repeat protein
MSLSRANHTIRALIERGEAPLRFPRLTTRRLMMLVAVLALALVAPRYWRHYRACREAAMRHEAAERHWRRFLGTPTVSSLATGDVAADPEAMMAHQAGLRRKYERAALRPWEVVPPDPLPPAPGLAMDFWLRERDYPRALAACDEAARADPANYRPHYIRAWILASCTEEAYRDGRAAIAAATRACELSGWRNEYALEALAASHAEAGEFDEALRWEGEALRLVLAGPSPGARDQRAKEVRARLELYRQGIPYRAVPSP